MDPSLIIILLFILAPLVERLLRGGKRPPQPPPRPPQQRIPERAQTEERPQVIIARREQESAAEMLPDDLWEILTGERRGPRPAPPPEPVEEEDEEAWSLETASAEDWIEEAPPEPEVLRFPREGRPAQVPAPRTAFERPLPEREAPAIVSLEQLEFDSKRRHERFHERIDQLRTQRIPTRVSPEYRFRNPGDLRRAIVLSEILGTPKGLR